MEKWGEQIPAAERSRTQAEPSPRSSQLRLELFTLTIPLGSEVVTARVTMISLPDKAEPSHHTKKRNEGKASAFPPNITPPLTSGSGSAPTPRSPLHSLCAPPPRPTSLNTCLIPSVYEERRRPSHPHVRLAGLAAQRHEPRCGDKSRASRSPAGRGDGIESRGRKTVCSAHQNGSRCVESSSE